jgi:hypothetical protein
MLRPRRAPAFSDAGAVASERREDTRMTAYRKELWFETPTRRAFLNITPQVEAALKESEIKEGMALINAMHITASVSSTTTRADSTPITTPGWKSWRRMNPFRAAATIERARTMPTPA